jgi:hypothetical protein
MSRLCIAPIVEGHGEHASIQKLLYRIWTELLDQEYVDVKRSIRRPRGRLTKRDWLKDAVREALNRLSGDRPTTDPMLVLLMLDSDGVCPAQLGPRLLGWAKEVDPRVDVACVVVHPEYETWFVAAAESLTKYIELGADEQAPDDPEAQRCKKAWVRRHFRGVKYEEILHQPAMTAAMDLGLCRSRSASFDKLCRELERRVQ